MFDFLYSIFGFLFRILFDFIGNYGLALLIFTLFFRIILLPSTVKQQKGSAKQVRLQPKIKRIIADTISIAGIFWSINSVTSAFSIVLSVSVFNPTEL